ncbi:MAG: fructosamine kinase family protein [Segniliparus sp.]|uniref:fructosamine kinase family protein n=1 Tax=Segniliparus sp. TaxID=2804064 RepID=UPI003F412466
MAKSGSETAPSPFVKRNRAAPPGFFACEAAGLRWLASAPSGVPCVPVLDVTDHSLVLVRLDSVPPSAAAAREFGRRLARTHQAGARGFGAGPDGWDEDGWFGPLDSPMPVPLRSRASWGEYYAHDRLGPMAERAGRAFSEEHHAMLKELVRRCSAGDFDDAEPPSRIHGDLWSGNVMWTAEGAVLIDPAAHGGHRETDLAYLSLFGTPLFEEIVAGYQEEHPLRPGWRERQCLHQTFMLLVHVVLFGRSYVPPTMAAVERSLALA